MPLILAVEPDRQQASHIVAVLRGRPRTELVIAESVAAALQAIAKRVPDLLLASPLLSRQDEARLAEWLRGLGPAAAHVQALTIPILARAAPETTRGMLSMLRRRKPRSSSPAGCEPAMFASQVGLYLERASRERVEEPAATAPPQPLPQPPPEWQAAEWQAAIEPEPEPAIARIDTVESNRIEAEIALASLRADDESQWVAGPVDDVREEPARVPEPAKAELVTDSMWMTPGPEVDELVAAAPPDSPDVAQVILLVPIHDLPPEPVVEASVSAPAAEIALAPLPADEHSRWVGVPLDDVRDVPVYVPEPAPAEPVFDNVWMLTSAPEVDELAAAAPPDSPDPAECMLLIPIYDLPPEPVVEAIVAPAVEVAAPAREVVAAAREVVAAPAIEPDPEPAMAATHTVVSNRIEAEIALPSLPADEDSLWVAAPLDQVRESPVRVPEPAHEWPEAAISVTAPPEWPSAIEADPPEPSVVAIEADAPERIAALIALAALRANEEAQWISVPLEDPAKAAVAMPEPALAWPVTDEAWMLASVPEVEELVAAAPADAPDTAPTILLTTIYDPPLQPAVEAFVAAPIREVVAPIREVVKAASPATTRRRKVEKPKKKPVQDEWGFFDPGQCGFAALLDKLDEITAQEAASGKRRDDVDVRVISY